MWAASFSSMRVTSLTSWWAERAGSASTMAAVAAGSFVFSGGRYLSGNLLFAAAGGSGALAFIVSGSPGIGYGGHPAGPSSYGGAGGSGTAFGVPDQTSAQSGSFPNGGAGACCHFGGGPAGGFGGGGRGGYNTGGGGGGAPGSGGGYSYVINTTGDSFGITGGQYERLRDKRLCVDRLRQVVGSRTFHLGDGAHGLRRARLAHSPAHAQAHAGLTRALNILVAARPSIRRRGSASSAKSRITRSATISAGRPGRLIWADRTRHSPQQADYPSALDREEKRRPRSTCPAAYGPAA
jgi:hypothetical protein